jgi:1-acyl-sn-glycerol-3-phosphate acyltransferase
MLFAFASQVVGFVLVGGAAIALAAWVVYQIRVSPFRPGQTLLWWLNVWLTRVLWRCEIQGRWPLPKGQGAVVICNHRSSIDPTFIALATKAVVHWMVAKEYCEHPALRGVLRTCEVIPTGRAGVDTASTRQAIRLAEQGELVGMFPEGRINTTPQMLLSSRPGAVLVALKARVPIVPCYIQGSPYRGTVLSPFFTPAHVRLVIGQPIDLSEYYGREHDREALCQATLRVLGEIARLGGEPDFRPTLAGRNCKPDE